MPESFTANFDCQINFDPAADLPAFLTKIPSKWVVYLMSDADGAPVQLLCVKNLRASLQRRLGENEQVGPSRRVGYRDLVRHIAWRRVDSAFEADCVYLELARQIFPQTYRGMLAFKEAWFLRIDPAAPFPRYTKTNDPAAPDGQLIGPIKDKDSAGRLIELIEDTFDLCRYHNVLMESPRGRACAYKEMGRCLAPCDGTASMEDYRQIVQRSIDALLHPENYRIACDQQMRQAAAELNFEKAGKIKLHLDRAGRLQAGIFTHLRSLEDFRFVSLQRGPRRGNAKIFLIAPGQIEETLGLSTSSPNWRSIIEYLRERISLSADTIDRPAAERMAIVASHLFSPKKQGSFIPLSEMNEKILARAYALLEKQKDEADSPDEGMVKDLQVI